MRRWWVVAGIVVLALAGLLALAVANLDRWLNANRGLVAERVEEALGREVSFGEVGLSFSGGLGVRVSELRVGEDPAFSEGDFVRAEAVDVLIRIWPALFGEIEVARVVLRAPEIEVIQTSQGLSTDSLGGGGAAAEEEPAGETSSGGLLIGLVDVQDGRFRYVDRSAQPAAEVELRAVDFRASDLSPDAPVRFELEAALGAARPNLEVSGTLGPLGSDAPALDIELALGPLPAESVLALGPVRQSLPEGLEVAGPVRLDASAAGTADALRFEAELDAESAAVTLGEGFSKPAGVPLRLALRGERSGDAASVESFEIRVDDAALRGRAKIASLERQSAEFSASSEALPLAPLGAGEPGDVLRDLSLEGTLAGERITARLRSPSGVLRGTRYADLAVDLALTGGRIEIEKAHMQAWGGTVSATGTYDTSAARPRFDLRTRAEQVSVGELLAERAPAAAARLTGTLDQELQLRGQGSGWEQIKPLLSGDGSLRLSSGIIKKINALAVYFRALGVIPFLADQGVVRFVDAHPELFLAEDTPYDRIGSLLQIRDGWVLLPDLELVKESYQLRSVRPGRYSLDHDLDLPLELVLSQPLSAEAVGYADRLRYFRGADGRLVLPLSVRGIPPIPTPDPQVLAGVAARAGASILVEKLLGSPPRSEQAPAGEEPGPAQPPAPEDVGAELLRRGLEGLLRGSDE